MQVLWCLSVFILLGSGGVEIELLLVMVLINFEVLSLIGRLDCR